MNDDAASIDDWLNTSGFVDAELDIADWADVDPAATGHDTETSIEPADDPWADISIGLPTLTDAQRQFLLGEDELAAADAEIIAIPDDPGDIEPFHPNVP